MRKLNNIFLTFVLLLLWCISFGQSYTIKFIMGNYIPIKKQNKVSFRCSPNFNQLNQQHKGCISVNWKWPKKGTIESIWDTEFGTTFQINSDGKLNDFDSIALKLFNIDSKYWENSISGRNLISFGNISLKTNQQKRVKWLQFYPTYGDVNSIKKYENLKYLILVENSNFVPRLSNSKINSSYYYSNQGVPLFGSHFIEKLNKLNYLEIQHNYNHSINRPYLEHRNQFLFLGGIPSNVLKLPNLSMLKIEYCDFLPVEYHDLEKFTYLDFTMQNHSKPELTNLAIIMDFYGKDQNTGNWKEYLEIVKMDSTFDIPQNGIYTSYYKNGQLLCKGNFRNGLPDGQWCFWFENGNISQQRTYHLGTKIGDWIIMSDNSDYNGINLRDTILTLRFKSDTLIQRIEKKIHNFSDVIGCYDYHGFFYDLSKSTSIYDFLWNSTNIKLIQHKYINQGFGQIYRPFASWKGSDTINGYNESWLLSDSSWKYNFSNFTNICPNDEKEIQFNASGLNGELALISSHKEKLDWNYKKQFLRFEEVDLKKGIAQVIEYERKEDDEEYHEIRRKVVRIEEILPKVFNGKK